MSTTTIPTTTRELLVGDVIRLVGTVWGRNEGDEVTVSDQPGNGSAYAHNGTWWLDEGGTWAWEFVSRPFVAPTNHLDLQVGDVIRLAGTVWGARAGEEHVIARHTDDGIPVTERMAWHIYDEWGFEFVSRPGVSPVVESDGSSVEIPADLTFTEYHPALLPLFARAAEAADEAGYCSEYDAIARVIGAPSRDEIKDLAATEYTVTIPLTVNTTWTVRALNAEAARNEIRRHMTYPEIRSHIESAIEGDRYGQPIARNVNGFQAQHTDSWTVSETPTT